MDESVKTDILRILKRMLEILDSDNYRELAPLSDNTIHNASIFQDEDSVSIAVIVYSLSKIIERYGEDIVPKVMPSVKCAHDFLIDENIDMYKMCIKKLLEKIAELDSKLKKYIDEVIIQAEIKKGSRLYEHGISMARASEVLGISEWELADYVGKTRIIDFEEVSEIERIKYAWDIFEIKD